MDDDSLDLKTIGLGLTVTQLARLFRMSIANVSREVVNITPLGTRHNSPIYDIAEIAPYLVKPIADVEELLKKMKPSEMPAALQKDYWAAQLARQSFEEKAGKLWKTEKVQEAFGSVLKAIRQNIALFNDTVDRQTGLTDAQRTVILDLSDALMDDLRLNIVKLFGEDYDSEGERDETFENGPPKYENPQQTEFIDDGLDDGL